MCWLWGRPSEREGTELAPRLLALGWACCCALFCLLQDSTCPLMGEGCSMGPSTPSKCCCVGGTVLRTHIGGVMSLQRCFTAGSKVSGGIRASPFGLHVHVGCRVERHCVNWKPQSFALLPAGLEEVTPRPVQDTGNILKQGYLEKRSRGKA